MVFEGKICPKCNLYKLANDFGIRTVDCHEYLQSFCKKCHKEIYSEKDNLKRRDRYKVDFEYREDKKRKTKMEYWKDPVKSKARRTAHLKAAYGLTMERYEEILNSQDRLCAICKGPETKTLNGYVLPMAIDHDHSCCAKHNKSCGKCVRGLLCHACNRGLAAFRDDINKMRAAISYLENNLMNKP